jgi:hypothetical protein
MKKEDTAELIDNLPEWFENLESDPSISIDNTLKICRERFDKLAAALRRMAPSCRLSKQDPD